MAPTSTQKITWDIIANVAYVVSIFLSTYIMAFDMLIYEKFVVVELVCDAIVVWDIIMYFFTAFEQRD
jgi:hypothetical protein